MIHLDAEVCIGCGNCIPTCPACGFSMNAESGKVRLAGPETFQCRDCGHCVAVCPAGAVSLDDYDTMPIPPETGVFADDLRRLMMTRRSVRHFRPEPVARETILQALEIARYAPTGSNLQRIRWVCIDDPAILKRLADQAATWLMQSPFTRPAAVSYFSGIDRILRNAPTLLLAHAPSEYKLSPQDCAEAIAHLELLFHSQGIGATWSGFIIMAMAAVPEMREMLGIPEDRDVYGGLLLGYALETFHSIPGRKPVHIEWL